MQIGNVTLSSNVILAPMAGVTDKAFREITKPFGPALMYSEMVSAKALSYNNKKTSYLLDISPKEEPVCVQLFGHEKDVLSDMAKRVEDSGIKMIDINMGCPAPKITSNGDGSALLKNPDLAGELIYGVSSSVKIPVTVKIRKGWDEKSIVAVKLAKIAEDAGAKAITVHGRTREEFYSGNADLEIIKEVKNAVKIPVIGNGDIKSGEDAENMLKITSCDAVMIGRASCGNPFIFKEVLSYLKGEPYNSPTTKEKLSVIKHHLDLLVEYKGEHIGILEARKHLSWYVKGLKNSARIKEEVFRAETKSEMLNILEKVMG